MQQLNALFYIVILIFSVVIHELSHGMVAYWNGDQTAYRAGRLTLNPLKHLEWFGSVILPLLLVISNSGFVFGWAKPVPYNPANLRNKKWGTVLVAGAGVISNILLAGIFALGSRLLPLATNIKQALALGFLSVNNELLSAALATGPWAKVFFVFSIIVLVNILLAVFNLVPIPPLDGSRILFTLLPARYRGVEQFLERYAIVVFLVFLVFLWHYVSPLILYLFTHFLGV